MSRFEGTVARTLDFGETITTGTGRVGRRLALPRACFHPSTHKTRAGDSGCGVRIEYKVLERRRRQAQITARRVLDLIDVGERAGRDAGGTEEGK